VVRTLTILETVEGIDRKFALHYYSRMRFIQNLNPLLVSAAKSNPPQLARVVSVLGPGNEGTLITDDLDLKTNFSLSNCATHAITMNSLMAETFSEQNPDVTYIHAYPGIVKTSLGTKSGRLQQAGINALYFLIKPWSVDLEESGSRHLFASTAARYPPRSLRDSQTPAASAEPQVGVEVASSTDGSVGAGSYMLSWDGSPVTKTLPILKKYREDGTKEKILAHTIGLLSDVKAHGKVQ
jgi:hypothetical protein